MNEQLINLKGQLREEIVNELKSQQLSNYSEDGFAKFSVMYPGTWELEHKDDTITFYNDNDNSWLSINNQLIKHTVALDKISTP